ncbi:hypothetical protein EDB85DRAFT_1993178, partial [Lactarius pseudohatsudake]
AERNTTFGPFGAIRAEVTLRELDPRRAEQRSGDSVVHWGGSTLWVAEVEDSQDDNGNMLMDQDIEADALNTYRHHRLRQKCSSKPLRPRPHLLRPGSPARHRPTPTPY